MARVYGDKRARTAIFAESADQLALEAAAAAEDAHANGALPNGSATVSAPPPLRHLTPYHLARWSLTENPCV